MVEYEVISSAQELMKSGLFSNNPLALDTETTGLNLDAEDFRVRLVAIATPHKAWVVQLERFEYPNLLAEMFLRYRHIKLVMHNLAFDIPALWHDREVRKAIWQRTTDTRILTHLLDPRDLKEGGTGHKLDQLAEHYLGEKKSSDALVEEFLRLRRDGVIPKKTLLTQRFKAMPVDNPVYLEYAARDAWLTARLYAKVMEENPRDPSRVG